ncbi:MAG: bifunctional diaminohydroxyphosphoribosylaminopyrimidine deaminase/5-amino-6-(5-phosphoribosylamino)uracil reductase RibD [Thiocapsa sp.]|jgi:diaminohydroxyphosphoribosylaminopyrimidine deaminase/5-amino-6-(5-phosphoribosylamino)uracil reductase|nr:bifunctional diaminohydroxyphosphoribosylaminopyrimidine deaminase/5-amino-6-(5-phosphoribosylamino)uracil reductase RibD [Thiocapsa sp.]MCG6896494.1 bifunctional diaminohydroxyphosphoribosylaminopyrimidine deaminase/5-amino-6-(5-phosphoribosylamino)uracil reductase RibD [Thiocapsa sp.]MCG6985317.1 bifunctional diaminohydroxyphosphoribosylaminopyrimidine deaminase/5-amino-6-(5-phosphoribosylamino)uracil reductase RibD [Thiocapsa sp.]
MTGPDEDRLPGVRPGADLAFMARAIELAERGRFTTHPNPRVGCLIVHAGRVVGEGWHRRAGEPHAERHALNEAGDRARGATAYVTLEPCCHQGRTPPCTDGLIQAGVARVVCAMVDPNPLVAGRGLRLLSEAGIRVETGLLEAPARALNPGFVKRMEQGRPHVLCKLAASLDGRTAMSNGESQWITGEPARREVQRLRAGSSAVVTGIGTLLADDPGLDVRLTPADLPGMGADEPVRQPLRVVVDSRWRTPPGSRILRLPGTTLIVGAVDDPTRMAGLKRSGGLVHLCRARGGQVDLGALMAELARREINEVLLETGPTLAGAALEAGLVDEIVVYLAPHLMGDRARGLFQLPGVARMSDRVPLEIVSVRAVGRDLRVTARPARDGGSSGA